MEVGVGIGSTKRSQKQVLEQRLGVILTRGRRTSTSCGVFQGQSPMRPGGKSVEATAFNSNGSRSRCRAESAAEEAP